MSVLVIHPEDRSTDFLSNIYKDRDDFTVIRDLKVLSDRERLYNIINEHDKIIMMGHGTQNGLLNPRPYRRLEFNDTFEWAVDHFYIIDSEFVDLLKTKETISIWCFSDMFFQANDLHGFHTGMIISEVEEEMLMLGSSTLSREEMLANMNFMADCFNKCIDYNPVDIKSYMLEHYVGDDRVTEFNRGSMTVC